MKPPFFPFRNPEDNDKRAKLSQNCRQIAEIEYPIELQLQRYIELY